MLLNLAILASVLVAGAVLWSKPVRNSKTWRAMTTPLASIIGSGFLVLGPILNAEYGYYAPLMMALLCVGSYLFGSAIRYNMRAIEEPGPSPSESIETVASWALSFAYIVSVAYYLNLFGAFAVSLTPLDTPFAAKSVTSGIYALILYVGWVHGFKSLERMEYISVTVKLAIIAGLLMGLAAYFGGKLGQGALVFNAPHLSGWAALTLGFGLIVTVQGFETSRYLGATYDTATRIKSMKWAQWLSALIYMAYILLMTWVFQSDELTLTETAIVDLMGVVAPILPLLLVAAALAAQFSAAVADTSGSGGLMSELSSKRLRPRIAYALLTAVGLSMTWLVDVFQIISYASRAFALYYALQSLIAARTAWEREDRLKCAAFAVLMVLGVIVAVLGQAVEG